MTHTYAVLDVSRATFDDVKRRLTDAGYEHTFHDDVIDMHGIALRAVDTPDTPLTFQQLIQANLSRVERWHSLDDWSVLEWAGAMCGEAGESANFAKKLRCVETEIANNDKRMFGLVVPKEQLIEVYRQGVGMEMADAIIYGALLCAKAKVDLVQCIRTAFNNKSMEYGFPERL